MTTALEKLILANKVDFYQLKSYKYLSLPFIEERKSNTKFLSCHPDITIDYVISHPQIKWDFIELSQHPNITLPNIMDHPAMPWDFNYVSLNPNVTLDDIIEYEDIPWDFYNLSSNKNMTIEFILNNLDQEWSWDYISENLATESVIQMYPDLDWDFELLTSNLNVSFEFIKQNPQYQWNYNGLSYRGDIPFEEIEKYNPDHDMMYKYYSTQIFKKYPLYMLDPFMKYKYIDLQLFDDLPKYDLGCLSNNINITLEFMRQHKNIRWSLDSILSNSNYITWDVILESDDEFHWTRYNSIYEGTCRI